MRSRAESYVRRCIVVGIGFSVIMGYLIRTRQEQAAAADRARPHGRYTYSQVVEMTEAVCRLITADNTAFQIFTEKTLAYDGNHKPHPHWKAYCQDERGKQIAHLHWDAESGDLMQIGCEDHERGEVSIENAKQAERRACEWLQKLNVASHSADWRIVGKTYPADGIWSVQAASKSQRVRVKLSASTGDLFHISFRPLKIGTIRSAPP